MRSGHAMIRGLQELLDYLHANDIGGAAVEVGSYAGESTEFFARHFRSLAAVDPWMFLGNVERAFDARMQLFPHVRKLKMKSVDALAHFPDGSLDFVYIDADHHYAFVSADIRAWKSKLRRGGILAGHDYSAKEPGVRRAVDEILGGPDRVFPDTSWLKRII